MRRAEQRPLADLTQSIDALIAEYYSRQSVPGTEEIPILNAKPKIEGRLTEGCRTVITATDSYGTRRGRRGLLSWIYLRHRTRIRTDAIGDRPVQCLGHITSSSVTPATS